MAQLSIEDLLEEYERALAYTDSLWKDLSAEQVSWRPNEDSSAVGWHLVHQAAVAHFMVRNLTAAEARLDPDLEVLADSATPEAQRGELPDCERIDGFRATVAGRVRFRLGAIADGSVGAPDQLRIVGIGLLTALINHEYQHSTWIAEVRTGDLGHRSMPVPESDRLVMIDGYPVMQL
ncbi:MAG: DinB family protein [Acidimicrobiales bacterium]